MSRSTVPYELDWTTSDRSPQQSEASGVVDPYQQAQIAVTAEGAGIRVVRVTGDLGSGSAACLDEVLGNQINARLAGLVVDLSAASFIGVRGVAALVPAADRARRRALALRGDLRARADHASAVPGLPKERVARPHLTRRQSSRLSRPLARM
jgi:STAS domain